MYLVQTGCGQIPWWYRQSSGLSSTFFVQSFRCRICLKIAP